MIPLERYAEVCNNLCLIYKGPSASILKEILRLRPILEQQYPQINIYVACRDELLNSEPRMLSISSLRNRKYDFAYMKEIRRADELWKK